MKQQNFAKNEVIYVLLILYESFMNWVWPQNHHHSESAHFGNGWFWSPSLFRDIISCWCSAIFTIYLICSDVVSVNDKDVLHPDQGLYEWTPTVTCIFRPAGVMVSALRSMRSFKKGSQCKALGPRCTGLSRLSVTHGAEQNLADLADLGWFLGVSENRGTLW